MSAYFHVASVSARQQIEADRFLWAGQSDDVLDLDEQGVYLFDNLVDAHRFGSTVTPFVDANGSDLGPQPWFPDGYDVWQVVLDHEDERCLVEDPLEDGGWMVPTEHGIEPAELTLLTGGTSS